MTERRLVVGRPPRTLEAVLAEPPGTWRGAAVVCHPHPQMGGDMENPVVRAVAGGFAGLGLAVLRFNFAGVGASGGRYGGGPDEVRDVREALSALPAGGPHLLAGYSFGAWAALRAAAEGAPVDGVVAVAPPVAFMDWDFMHGLTVPVTFVVGDGDRFCPLERLAGLVVDGRRVVTLPGADHFLAGSGREVAAAAADAVRPLLVAA